MRHVVSMVWSLVLLIAFLWWANKSRAVRVKNSGLAVTVIVLLSLVVRFIPAFFTETGTNYDIESYRLVSEHVINLEDVYTAPGTSNRHPYLPLQMYWLGTARILADSTAISFNSMVKLLPILADTAIGVLLYYFFKQKSNLQKGFHAGISYALNPVSVFVSAYHGQFDALPVLSILLSIYLLDKHLFLSGFSLGVGILNKSWPILFFPQAWQNIKHIKKKILFTLSMGIPPLLGVILYQWVYKARALTAIKRAVSYNHGIGAWGYTYFLGQIVAISETLKPFINGYRYNFSKFTTLLILGIIWFAYARHKKPLSGFLLILLTFFSFTHAFATQYLVWIVPFAILTEEKKWLNWYTITSFFYMFIIYNTVINHFSESGLLPTALATQLSIPASLPIWIVVILWFLSLIRKSKAQWSFHLKSFLGINPNID